MLTNHMLLGANFKVLSTLKMLIQKAKELQLNQLDTVMLEDFLDGYYSYFDYHKMKICTEGKEVCFTQIEKTLNTLKAYLLFASEKKGSVFLKLYDAASSVKTMIELISNLQCVLEDFLYEESANLRKFKFSKCISPFSHVLRQKDHAFEKYLMKNTKVNITFPFAKGEHICYEKIYARTIEWVINPDSERLIYMGGTGNFYDTEVDKLLVHDKHLDYPTCEFFYRDKKIKLHGVTWVCKMHNIKTKLRCNENLFSTHFEDIDKNILSNPPCNLLYLTIEIYGDLVYFTI